MINREVTRKDIILYIFIIFILIFGFWEKAGLLISSIIPDRISYILILINFMSNYLSPKVSIIISLIIFIFYTSVRFFDLVEVRYFIVFGGMLYLGYCYDGRLTQTLSLFYATAIVAVPQLINTLIFTIFKKRYKY